jgi:uncharacterized OB-fold protein
MSDAWKRQKAAKSRVRAAERVHRLRAAGLCISCGKVESAPHVRCRDCLRKGAEAKRRCVAKIKAAEARRKAS